MSKYLWTIFLFSSLVFILIPEAVNAFTCTIRSGTSCNAGEVCTFSMWNLTDSHAAECGSYTNYTLCCDFSSSNLRQNNCNSGEGGIASLYNTSNSHVETYKRTSYNYHVCVTPSYGCNLRSSCISGESSVVSMYNYTDSHVAQVNYYSNQLCCSQPPSWSQNSTSVSSPATYIKGRNYGFQINWTDAELGVSGVSQSIFEFGSTNYTKSTSPAVQNNTQGIFWINLTDLAVGSYNYRWYANDTSNVWNTSTQWTYTINQATPTSTLTLTPSSPITYGTATTAICSSNSTDSGVVVKLYRDSSDITSENNTAVVWAAKPSGYTVVCNSTATTNYTSATTSQTYVVNKAGTLTRLFLNGTEGNNGYNENTTANFTVTLNVSGKTVKLDTNITGWVIQSSTTPLYNYTIMRQVGKYNITGYFESDENYTTSSQTYYATVSVVNYTINTTLSPSKAWWNDTVTTIGIVAKNNQPANISTVTVTTDSETKCTVQTNTSGHYNCTFRAPLEVGSYTVTARTTIVDQGTENIRTASATLTVAPYYGGTLIGTGDRVAHEVPMLIQEPSGRIRWVWVNVMVWKG